MDRIRRRPMNSEDIANYIELAQPVVQYNSELDTLVDQELSKIKKDNAEYEERQKELREAAKQKKIQLDALEQSDRIDLFLNSKLPAEIAAEFDEDAGEAWGWNKDNWESKLESAKRNDFFYEKGNKKHSDIANTIYTALAAQEPILKLLPHSGAGIIGSTVYSYVFDKLSKGDKIRNAIDYFGIQKNEAEIKDAQGRVLRAQEKQQLLEVVNQFQKNNEQLLNLQNLLTSQYTTDSQQDVAARFEILKEIGNIIDQNTQLLPQVKSASTYSYDDELPFSPTPEYMPHDRREGGKTANAIKEAIDLFNKTDWGNRTLTTRSLERISNNLNRFNAYKSEFDNNVLQNIIPDAIKSINEDKQDLEKYYVDPAYKRRAEAAQRSMKFTDLDTYLYGLPGVLGSSASNNGIQLASQATKMLGAGLTASGVGAEFGIPLTLTGMMLGISSGEHENNAEVASNYQTAFQKKLERNGNLEAFIKETSDHAGRKLNFEEAFDHFIFNPESVKTEEIKTLAASTLLGANNLFANDMMAVTGSELLEASIGMFVPLGNRAAQAIFGKGLKSTLAQNIARFAESHPYVGKPAEFIARSLNSVTPGTPFIMVVEGAWGTTKTALRRPFNAISRELSKRLTFFSSDFLTNPGLVMSRNSLIKRSTGLIAAELGMGLSESIEEGKQHIHGEAFQKGEFAGDKHNLFDIIMDDISAEARAGYAFIGNTLFGLKSDPELLAEMRGGFLAPFGNVSSIYPMIGRIGDIGREMTADQVVGNNVMAMKLQDNYTINTGIQYAKAALDKKLFNFVLNSFDKMKTLSSREEQRAKENEEEYDGFTQEEIDSQKQLFLKVAAIANDTQVMQSAKERGINPGSEDYATVIGLYNYALDRIDDAEDKVDQSQVPLDEMLNNLIVSEDEFNQIHIGTIGAIKDLLFSRNNESKNIAIPERRVTETDEEFMQRGNLEYRANAIDYIKKRRNYISLISEIDAIISRIQLLNAIENKTSAQKSQLNFYQNALARAKRKINHEDLVRLGLVNVETSEDVQKLVNPSYQEDHNAIKKAYDTLMLHQIALEEALDLATGLLGNYATSSLLLDNSKLAPIIKRISKESEASHGAIKKSIKSGTREILDEYKNSVKQDQQFVQYFHDAFEQQRNLIDRLHDEFEEETTENRPFDFTESEMDEMVSQITSEYEMQLNRKQSEPYEYERTTSDDSVDLLEEYGAEGKRGRKQINAIKQQLNEAKTDIEQIDALSRFEENVRRGAYATDREKDIFQQLRNRLKSDGYETQLKVGDPYDGDSKVSAEFIIDDSLQPGEQVIRAIKKPQINKDGKMIRSGEIVVAQSPVEKKDLGNDSKPPKQVLTLNNDPQQQTVELIRQTIENQKDKVVQTPRDYFFLENGKVVRIPRVHSVKDPLFEPSVSIKNALAQNIQKLTRLYDSDIEQFKAEAKKMADAYNNKLKDIYGEDSRIYLENAVSVDLYLQDSVISDRGIIDSIANLVTYADTKYKTVTNVMNRSVIGGTIADTIQRMVFGGKELLYSESYGMPKDIFDAYVESIKKQKKAYEDQGYVIITDAITLRGKIEYKGNIVEVAGQPDMLLVDKNGDIKIVDFKTGKYSYLPVYRYTVNLPGFGIMSYVASNKEEVPKDAISVQVEYPALDNKSSAMSMSTRQSYIEQLEMYSKMIEYMFADQQVKVIDLELLPSNVRIRAGKNKLGFVDATVFDRFASSNETTLVEDDDKLPGVNYIELRQPITLGRVRSTQLPVSVTEKPQVDLTTLYSIVEKINALRNRLASEYNAVKDSITPDLLDRFQSSKLTYTVLQQRYEALISDADQKSNLDTVKQLETDLQWYANSLEEMINDIASPKDDPIQDAPPQIPPEHLELVEFKKGIFRYVHIDQSGLDRLPYAHELRRVMSLPDFLETATFELDVEGWNRVRRSPKAATVDYIKSIHYTEKKADGTIINHVFGETGGYVPIQIHLSDNEGNRISRNQVPLVSIIDRLIADPKNKGKRIFLKPFGRTNGVADYSGELKPIGDAFGFNDEQISKLLDGSADGQLGIVSRGNVRAVLHNSQESEKIIHLFDDQKGLTDGMVVLEYNLQYTEDGNQPWKHSIPVTLIPKTLQPTDIDLILDCLKNWHKQRNIVIDGKTIKSPLTNRQLLTFLIRFGNQSTITGNRFVFDFAQKGDGTLNYNVVRFGGIRTGENEYSEVQSYDLSIPSAVDALRQQLQKVSVYYNAEYVLRQNLSETDSNKKLYGLREFFQQNPEIDQVSFSESLTFDRSDVDSANDGTYKGISIAHWMIKHGWMLTKFNGVSNPMLAFNDAYVEDLQQQQIEIEQTVTEQPEESITGSDIIYDPNAEQEQEDDDVLNPGGWSNKGLNKKQSKAARIPLDKEKAIARIKKILGKDFPVDVIPDLIDQDDRVVGRMKIASIILSEQAEYGTEYHEAFHDVIEFKIGEKRRQRLFDYYRKKYGNPKMSDTEITEALADRFQSFRTGIVVKDDHVINDSFRQLLGWCSALVRLNDFKLAKLFVETSLGLYAPGIFSKATRNPYTRESIQNFMNRYNQNYLNYSVADKSGHQVKLQNFANGQQLNDAISGLLYMLIRGAKIDNLGTNISQLNTTLTGVKETLGKTYSSMIGEGLTDEQLSKLPRTQQRNIRMMREIFDKWDILTRRMLISQLERIGVNSKLHRKEQYRQDMDGGESSAVHDDIEGHEDEFWSHSRADDVSAAVKFFLSTIPAQRYATEEDIKSGQIGTDGNMITQLVTTNKKGQPVRTKVVTKRNSLGYTSFLPFNFVYQTLLKNFYGVRNVSELDTRLTIASQNDLMFEHIARAFHNFRYKSYIRYSDDVYKRIPKVVLNGVLLDPQAYVKDVNKLSEQDLYPTRVVAARDITIGDQIVRQGEIIPNAVIVTNPDYESITTQIYQAIKSQKLDFTFCFQNVYSVDGKQRVGNYTYDTSSTNTEQAQRNYPHQWFNNVRSLFGGILNGTSTAKTTAFKDVAQVLRQMRSQLAAMASGRVDNVFGLNPNTLEGYDALTGIFVSNLNKVGITIDKQMLNYMLLQSYPESTNIQASFIEFVTSRGIGSLNTFIDEDGILEQLQKAIDDDNFQLFTIDSSEDTKKGTINSGSYLYSTNTFIKNLSKWYGRYKAAALETMTIGPNNTQMFTFAENHTASDIVDDLKHASVDATGKISGSQVLQDLVYQEEGSTEPVYYNSFIDNTHARIGSVIVKTLMNPEFTQHQQIRLSTHSGMKSDQRRDGGRKYTEITAKEDWLTKADILSNGWIVFPTLSDKSTWFYLRGFYLPGLQWKNGKLQNLDVNRLLGVDANNNIHVTVYDQIDQLIEYAKCDLANALFVQDQLTQKKIPDTKMVKNFHTGDEHGARLAFMIGMYKEDGTYISFNNNKRSPKEDIKEAYAYFFNQPLNVQRQIMLRSVQKRLEQELDDLVNRGIITYNEQRQDGRSKFFGYRNKYLDADKINQLKELYKSKTNSQNKSFGTFLSDGQLESLAILTYVNDVNVRSNMSLQETQRIFTGMPHFFKWKYDDKSGELLDMREDESKRYGGLGSTGTNNRIDLPNIETEYTCAEIKDWEVGSPISKALYPAFLDNKLRQAVVDSRIANLYYENPNATEQERRNIYKEVYDRKFTIEEMEKELGEISNVLKAQAKREAGAYEKDINVADGTAFITDKMAENLLRQRGAYTKNVAKAFSFLRRERGYQFDYLSDSDAYRTIYDALISTQKYSAFGYRKEFGMPIHYYNKFALFPIFEGISYGFTHDLYQKMNGTNGVDMVMFESAVKVGSEGVQRFDPDMTAEEVAAFSFKDHIYRQKYSFIRRQLNTDPRMDEIMSMGTQAAKVALSSLRDDQVYTTDDGSEITGQALKTQIMDDINELSLRGYNAVKEEFLSEDGSLSVEKFSQFIKNELMSRNADKNILDAVEVVYDKDEDGNNIPSTARFRADLNSVSNMAWIESIVVSHINSQVIDINLPGNAYYQRSVFGMEKTPYHLMNDEDIKDYQINDGEQLQMINEDGSMDAVISIDYFMHLIPEEIRYNFKAARQWLIDSGIIGKSAKANIMAYRIPTQAPSSIHALRIVDVIHTVRDTIILPKEFTKITGSDFDIDKLYLSSLNYQIGEDGLATSVFNENDSRSIQNRLLNNYLSLLKQGGKQVRAGELEIGKYIHSLQRSIDNDTELLTGKENGVLTRIEANRKKQPERPLAYGSLSVQVGIKDSFITGKMGIGPFALNNNSQILTQLYNVSFAKGNGILDWLNARSLHDYTDRDDNSILSWIGALINAHVDVARDPYILRLNVNKYTWNLLNLLVRTGFGDDAFFFINQPILQRLAEEYDNMSGTVVDDPGTSPTQRVKENERLVVGSLFNNWGYNTSLGSILKSAMEDGAELDDSHKAVFQALFGVDKDGNYKTAHTILEDIMTNPKALVDPQKGVTLDNLSGEYLYEAAGQKLSPRDVQAYVFLAKLQFEPYTQAMSDLVNYTKIDTKKQGINYTEQLQYERGYNDLRINTMFDSNLQRLLDESFIDKKTTRALELLPKVLKTEMIQFSDPFQNAISAIQERLNTRSSDSRKAIQRGLMSYIKQKAMNVCMANLGIDFKPMVSGENTIAKRLIAIRNKMLQNPEEFSDFVSNGDIINSLLANLSQIPHQTPFGYEQFDLVGLDNTEAVETEIKDGYVDDWLQMYESDDEEIKTFARDLAIYAFMTSADNPGFTTFFKYVPLQIREDIGYVTQIHRMADAFKNNLINVVDKDEYSWQDDLFTINIRDVIRNNWRNNNIVPVWKRKTWFFIPGQGMTTNDKIVDFVPLNYQDMGVDDEGNPIFVTKNTPKLFIARVSKSKRTGKYPLFLKIPREGASRFDANPYILYELITVAQFTPKNSTVAREYPLYGITRQPGHEILAGSSTYMFYENDRDDDYQQIIAKEYLDDRTAWFSDQIAKLQDYMENHVRGNGKYRLSEYLESGIEPFEGGEYTKDLADEIKMIRDAAISTRKQVGIPQDTSSNIQQHVGDWSREEAEANPDILYVFTDNTDRNSGSEPIDSESWYSKKYGAGHHYPKSTQAVLRGLDNARPVSTQRWYHSGATYEKGNWHDSDFEEFKKVIDDEFNDIVEAWNTGKYKTIMFGSGDILLNGRISNITMQRTPMLYQYLYYKLNELEGIVDYNRNSVGNVSEANQFDQFVRDNSNWNDSNEFSDEEMKHCKH